MIRTRYHTRYQVRVRTRSQFDPLTPPTLYQVPGITLKAEVYRGQLKHWRDQNVRPPIQYTRVQQQTIGRPAEYRYLLAERMLICDRATQISTDTPTCSKIKGPLSIHIKQNTILTFTDILVEDRANTVEMIKSNTMVPTNMSHSKKGCCDPTGAPIAREAHRPGAVHSTPPRLTAIFHTSAIYVGSPGCCGWAVVSLSQHPPFGQQTMELQQDQRRFL